MARRRPRRGLRQPGYHIPVLVFWETFEGLKSGNKPNPHTRRITGSKIHAEFCMFTCTISPLQQKFQRAAQ
jgi:hypothetical protein